ncbi:MAG TPA: hypothetical protein VJO99_16210 [Burkholderiaceae bacterium]|nr:hypothetical protein [Burkholderiaceae bacterium]
MPRIFVFGSNLAGRHGKGAALDARLNYGAISGRGEGLQGASYAIPTKDHALRPLPLEAIERHVRRFLLFAEQHPELVFEVTPIGCGLAGYKPEQIAPMFKLISNNVLLPPAFQTVIDATTGLATWLAVAAEADPDLHDLAEAFKRIKP